MASTTEFALTNSGLVEASFEVAISGGSGGTLSFSGDSVLGALETGTFTFDYAPDLTFEGTEVFSVTIDSADLAEPFTFFVSGTTFAVFWTPIIPAALEITEGGSQTFEVFFDNVPNFDTVIDDLVFVVSGDASQLKVSGTEIDVGVYSVEVRVADDFIREDDETLELAFASVSGTTTMTIPANDQFDSFGVLEDNASNDEDVISVAVSGLKPQNARIEDASDTEADLGFAVVKISPSDISSKGGAVRVVIVEEETDEYVDPNVDVVEDGKQHRVAGTSFAVELDGDAVLVRPISVDVKYRCGIPADSLELFVFNTELSTPRWVPANSMCAPEDIVAPEVLERECMATFTICHLTQFAVAESIASETIAAVDGTVANGSSGDDEDSDINWNWVLFGISAFFAFVIFFIALARRRRRDEEEPIVDLESGFSSSSDAAYGSSSGLSTSSSGVSTSSSGLSTTDSALSSELSTTNSSFSSGMSTTDSSSTSGSFDS